VSSVGTSDGNSSGRTIAVVILAIVAILFIVAGFIYIAEPAKSLPSIMGQIKGSNGHHALRAAGSFVVGVVFAVGAWFAKSYRPKQSTGSNNSQETAGLSQR
jgi:amino acid permease